MRKGKVPGKDEDRPEEGDINTCTAEDENRGLCKGRWGGKNVEKIVRGDSLKSVVGGREGLPNKKRFEIKKKKERCPKKPPKKKSKPE